MAVNNDMTIGGNIFQYYPLLGRDEQRSLDYEAL
jgi:hypothetical protein